MVARANEDAVVGMLRTQGASEVVQPEFEAALEFVRHTLGSFTPDPARLEAELAARRDGYYRTRRRRASMTAPTTGSPFPPSVFHRGQPHGGRRPAPPNAGAS